MFTVGTNVGLGGGNSGDGPTPAETGSLACSPQADRPSAAMSSINEAQRGVFMAIDLLANGNTRTETGAA
jgi:hypothetical protein